MSNSSPLPDPAATRSGASDLFIPQRLRVDIARCRRLKFVVVYLRGVCRVLGYDLDHMRTAAQEMGADPRALFDRFDYERTNQLLIRQFADRLDLLHHRLAESIADVFPGDTDSVSVTDWPAPCDDGLLSFCKEETTTPIRKL